MGLDTCRVGSSFTMDSCIRPLAFLLSCWHSIRALSPDTFEWSMLTRTAGNAYPRRCGLLFLRVYYSKATLNNIIRVSVRLYLSIKPPFNGKDFIVRGGWGPRSS